MTLSSDVFPAALDRSDENRAVAARPEVTVVMGSGRRRRVSSGGAKIIGSIQLFVGTLSYS
jgi:hypothetical protein